MQFQPVNPPAAENSNGIMQIVRGGKFITLTNGEKSEAALKSGDVFTGVYSGTEPNKFNPERVDYSLRSEDGTLIILSQCASLKQQLDKVSTGELLQITYKGKREITRKTGAKAEMHDFVVARAVDAE